MRVESGSMNRRGFMQATIGGVIGATVAPLLPTRTGVIGYQLRHWYTHPPLADHAPGISIRFIQNYKEGASFGYFDCLMALPHNYVFAPAARGSFLTYLARERELT